MRLFIAIALMGLCNACKTKEVEKSPLPENVFSSYHTAVVLIKNEFLYKVEATGGDKPYYCNGLQDGIEGDLCAEYDSAYRHRNIMFGTGFFIDKYGVIATNRHVIEGDIPLYKLGLRIKARYDSLTVY